MTHRAGGLASCTLDLAYGWPGGQLSLISNSPTDGLEPLILAERRVVRESVETQEGIAHFKRPINPDESLINVSETTVDLDEIQRSDVLTLGL